MNIILIGYRASGKTSVGRELARLLNRPFFDSDRMIFAKTGKTIREIVEAGGWQVFRETEKALIAELSVLDDAVIALGGGAVMDPGNVAALRDRGRFVWLRADARTLARRMQREKDGEELRPSLTGAGPLEEIEEVLAGRMPVYRAVADMIVDTAGKNPAAIAAEITGAQEARQTERSAKKNRRQPNVR